MFRVLCQGIIIFVVFDINPCSMTTHCMSQYAKLIEWHIYIDVHPCCPYQREQQVCHCPVALALIYLHQVSCKTTSWWDNPVLSYENWTKLLFQSSAANLHQLPSCSKEANPALLNQRPLAMSAITHQMRLLHVGVCRMCSCKPLQLNILLLAVGERLLWLWSHHAFKVKSSTVQWVNGALNDSRGTAPIESVLRLYLRSYSRYL